MTNCFLHKSTTLLPLIAVGFFSLIVGCAEQKPDLPVILKINGEEIYIDELDLLGRTALAKAGMEFDSEAGQKRYKEIAPNLYNTLIDLYVIQHAAKLEGIEVEQEKIDAEYNRFVQSMQDQGAYEQFMTGLGLDDERLRELIQDMLAMNILQNTKLNEGKAEPTEQEIKDFYYQNHFNFRYPNRLRASHIFFKATENDSPVQHEKAKEKAIQILKHIGNEPGQRFIRMAQTYSEDPGNAPRGGDLGFITRESVLYPETFKKAAWALQEGDVSDVVQTPLGYHIIWVTDHEQSLEEATAEIKQYLAQKAMTEHFEQWKRDARGQMEIERYFDPETYTVLDEPVPDTIPTIPTTPTPQEQP